MRTGSSAKSNDRQHRAATSFSLLEGTRRRHPNLKRGVTCEERHHFAQVFIGLRMIDFAHQESLAKAERDSDHRRVHRTLTMGCARPKSPDAAIDVTVHQIRGG
jgi:hypothetical protein